MADEEGGRYANDLFMDASTKDVAQGFVSSSHTHPRMSCSWESTFVIVHPPEGLLREAEGLRDLGGA